MRIHFQLYRVATELANSSWIRSSVVEQMPAIGMVVSSSLAGSVGFPTVSGVWTEKHQLTRLYSLDVSFIVVVYFNR